MTTVEAVMTALADEVDAIAGLRVYPHPPDASELPCAFLMPPTIPTADIGLSTVEMSVEFVFLVPASEDRYAKQLWKYQDITGPDSLLARIQTHRNLGFTDVDVMTGAWRSLGMEEMAGYGAYGASCTLTISIG
jgi:hypothetical protein